MQFNKIELPLFIVAILLLIIAASMFAGYSDGMDTARIEKPFMEPTE